MARSMQAIAAADLPAEKRLELNADAQANFADYFSPGWAMAKALEAFVAVEAWAKVHGISPNRIILGEFGAIRPKNFDAARQAERAGYYRLMRTEAERRGYGWSTWEWSTEFGISKAFDGREFDPVMLGGLGLGER